MYGETVCCFTVNRSLGGIYSRIRNRSGPSDCRVDYEFGINQPGNILITDQFNNRVIEIDKAGNIVWQFGNGPGDTSANAIAGTNDAERVGSLTLMSGTGVPPGATNKCKKGYCYNHVLLVVHTGIRH